jgi:lipopolysaccharide export system protein LptC
MTASAPESSEPRTKSKQASAGFPRRARFEDYFTVTERPRARRYYGKFVGVAKLLLVTLAAGLAVLLAVWPVLHPRDAPTEIGQVSGIQEEDVDSLRITNAKLTGVSKDGQPYLLTFDDATQISQQSDLVKLTAPKADVQLKDGAWVALSSPRGRYHRGDRILELDGDVAMFHESGMEMMTGNVTFNLESGTGAGYEPMHVQAPFGTFDARGFRIRDDTAIFYFPGPVHAILYSVPEIAK